MDNIEQLRDLIFLDIRAKLGEELSKYGLITSYKGSLGWWIGEEFLSLYDLMEAIRDQR